MCTFTAKLIKFETMAPFLVFCLPPTPSTLIIFQLLTSQWPNLMAYLLLFLIYLSHLLVRYHLNSLNLAFPIALSSCSHIVYFPLRFEIVGCAKVLFLICFSGNKILCMILTTPKTSLTVHL